MIKEIEKLKDHKPCAEEVNKYITIWNKQESNIPTENALDRLFRELCPKNTEMEDILIKCSALNEFYSTNIFSIAAVAKHIKDIDIDERLANEDLDLVNDLMGVEINGKLHHFYSFATKYCSHHRPDIYPIYDSYVHQLLKYFRDRDNFGDFKDVDLRNYRKYVDIIQKFKKYYELESFNVKDLDKYLWQLGKEAFSPYQ